MTSSVPTQRPAAINGSEPNNPDRTEAPSSSRTSATTAISPSSTEPDALTPKDRSEQYGGEVTVPRMNKYRRTMELFNGDVDPKGCRLALTVQCFMTGYIAATSFSACYIWCPFQTGNIAQLGLALARTFERNAPHDFLFPDKQAFTSLSSFILGTSLGRIGDRWVGNHTRRWLVGATVVQGVFLVVACLMVHFGGQPDYAPSRGDPSWTNGYGFAALAFVSAAVGLQGIIGVRLNTQFGTTLVLTTIWCTLLNDPFLFALKPIPSRDHKILAAFFLFFGAFVSRAIIDASSTTVVLAIGAGLKVASAGLWLIVRDKPKPVAKVEEKTA